MPEKIHGDEIIYFNFIVPSIVSLPTGDGFQASKVWEMVNSCEHSIAVIHVLHSHVHKRVISGIPLYSILTQFKIQVSIY